MMTDAPMEMGYPEEDSIVDKPEAAPMAAEICVPLSALASPDETDKLQEPAEGDLGDANVEFRVNRVAGQNAYVTLTAINGKRLGSEEGGEPSEAAEEASIRASLNQPV